MKLKKLTIHNIASIEDATIDFAGKELANQDLFLICGPTGSGKTTILDAICLALFNDTPRIEKSENEKFDSLAEKDDKTIQSTRDVQNLMRKNSDEASVELTFEGTDEREYKALWGIRRKIRKNGSDAEKYKNESREERLNRVTVKEWSVTDYDGKVYSKVSEVKDKIQEVVQMNFDQFCKTTMLAQGDFTKFLLSSSDEKAAILEKLVGTEIYSKVGKVINTKKNNKNTEINTLKGILEGISFLSEEEVVERKQKIETLGQKINSDKELQRTIGEKLKWIENSAKVNKDAEEATAQFEQAKAANDSPTVKESRNTVNLWNITADVRRAMDILNECAEDRKKQSAKKVSLENAYANCVAGLNFLKAQKDNLEKSNSDLEKSIQEQAQFSEMFANAKVICDRHKAVVNNEAFISSNQNKLTGFDEEISRLKTYLEEQEETKRSLELEIAKIEAQISELNNSLNDLGESTITNEADNVTAHKIAIVQAQEKFKSWSNLEKDCTVKQMAYTKATDEQKLLQASMLAAEAEKDKAEQKANESKGLYENSMASVSDHAKALRAQLKKDDLCPVCGKPVDEVLSDEAFAQMFKPVKDKMESDQKVLKTCTENLANAKANFVAGEKNVKKAKNEADEAKHSLDDCLAELKNMCNNLNIECEAKNVGDALEKLMVENAKQQKAIGERQDEITAVRNNKERLSKSVSDIRSTKLEPTVKVIDATNQSIAGKNEERQKLNGEINAKKTDIETDKQYISEHINPNWEPTDSTHFYNELLTAANAYNDSLNVLSEKKHQLEQNTTIINNAETSKSAILNIFADWSKHNNTESNEVANLLYDLNNLSLSVSTLATQIANTSKKETEAKDYYANFFETNKEVKAEAVTEISKRNATEIEKLQNDVKVVEDNLNAAKVKHELALQRKDQLAENPLAEGETEEGLKTQNASLDNEQNEMSQEIGKMRKELEVDENNRKEQGEKKQELERLQAEYGDLSLLDKYFGSTDGKNFRNIAQSFILSDLLDKANSYLQNISDRYVLFCNPSTLTIMMRDNYQGGIERPTNTLSGGESFIISLSLALGLSSMQSVGFTVDTLFIDEGFGTLSPEYLDPVITSLKRLYQVYGRRVGIISHVESLKTSISTSIEVTPNGNSSSDVRVVVN